MLGFTHGDGQRTQASSVAAGIRGSDGTGLGGGLLGEETCVLSCLVWMPMLPRVEGTYAERVVVAPWVGGRVSGQMFPCQKCWFATSVSIFVLLLSCSEGDN